jgi:hypothetical protein
LRPAAGPSLSWQEELTRRVSAAEPVLRPATADEVLRCVGELGPVVVTGHGPGHEARTVGDLRWRRRRVVAVAGNVGHDLNRGRDYHLRPGPG